MPQSTEAQHLFDEITQTLESLRDQVGRPALPAMQRLRLLVEDLRVSLEGRDDPARLLALYDVSRALGSSLQLDEVLNQVMDSVIKLTGAERGFLLLLNRSGEERSLQVGRNFEGKNLTAKDVEVSRTVIQEVLRTGAGVLTTNAQSDDRFSNQQSVVAFALRSILCVPLRSRGTIIGVVYVDNRIRQGLFQTHDQEMLEAFAAQAAVAIENARLYTQADSALAQRVRELETLQDVDRQLNAGLDAGRVLGLTLDWAMRGTQAELGWIAIRDPESERWVLAAGEGAGGGLSLDDPAVQHILRGEQQVAREADPHGPSTRLLAGMRHGNRIIALVGVRAATFSPEAEVFLQRLSEHAAAAIENTRLYQAVQQANLAKSQFITVVSHELKTPMTSIRGYADLVRQGAVGPVTPPQSEFLDIVLDNVDRMASLVSDLTDISRIETGRLKINPARLDLAAYVLEAVTGFRPQLDARRLSLITDLPDGLPALETDPSRLMQILTNLLSNAVKYTPEGGRIRVLARQEGESLRVAIEDTGIGMTQEEQAKLFTQFFRSEAPAVREQPGWGLGLSVTRSLIELLGGKMGVQSEPGVGSTFTFTLPLSARTMPGGTAGPSNAA
jgi:signal transduction histidine kinase